MFTFTNYSFLWLKFHHPNYKYIHRNYFSIQFPQTSFISATRHSGLLCWWFSKLHNLIISWYLHPSANTLYLFLFKTYYIVFGPCSNFLDQKIWLNEIEWICWTWIIISSQLNIMSRISVYIIDIYIYIPIFTFSFGQTLQKINICKHLILSS